MGLGCKGAVVALERPLSLGCRRKCLGSQTHGQTASAYWVARPSGESWGWCSPEEPARGSRCLLGSFIPLPYLLLLLANDKGFILGN